MNAKKPGIWLILILAFVFIARSLGKKRDYGENRDQTSENLTPDFSGPKPNEADFFEYVQNGTERAETVEVDWKIYQDSMRKILYDSKPDQKLKESFLEELYLRGAVEEDSNRLYFNFVFDIHGLDCGAPDCYETDISFNFNFGDELVFPETINYREQQTGCVDEEYLINSTFQLTQKSEALVLYHDNKRKTSLLIYGIKSEFKDALYFVDFNIKEINTEKPYENYSENSGGAIYSSWILTTPEYNLLLP